MHIACPPSVVSKKQFASRKRLERFPQACKLQRHLDSPRRNQPAAMRQTTPSRPTRSRVTTYSLVRTPSMRRSAFPSRRGVHPVSTAANSESIRECSHNSNVVNGNERVALARIGSIEASAGSWAICPCGSGIRCSTAARSSLAISSSLARISVSVLTCLPLKTVPHSESPTLSNP